MAKRRKGHWDDATVKKRDTAFCRALRKYGKDGFTWEVLEDNIPDSELDYKEKYYIGLHNTYLDKQHYNMTEGGEGYKPSEEVKAKISKSNTGKKRTEAQKQLQSARQKGRTHSEETKRKMSEVEKTDEWKANISQSLKGKPKSETHRLKLSESKTEKITLIAEKDDVRLVFYSRKEAYEYCINTGLTTTNINTFRAGLYQGMKTNQRRYGFKWRIESSVETIESSQE